MYYNVQKKIYKAKKKQINSIILRNVTHDS